MFRQDTHHSHTSHGGDRYAALGGIGSLMGERTISSVSSYGQREAAQCGRRREVEAGLREEDFDVDVIGDLGERLRSWVGQVQAPIYGLAGQW